MTAPAPTAPPSGSSPARLQQLAAAALAGGEDEELLEPLLSQSLSDLGAQTLLAVLPAGSDRWDVEIALGADAPEVLGAAVDPQSSLGAALARGDADAIEAVDVRELLDGTGQLLVAAIDAGSEGAGALVARWETGDADAPGIRRGHLDAVAALVGVMLLGPAASNGGATANTASAPGEVAPSAEDRAPGAPDPLDEERSRIARDLHDLAIQELFAAGMELESLQQELHGAGGPGPDVRIDRRVEASVQGIERAVAQIRQIVQSLRRERPQATLTELLRHETGIATAGLGFAPSLRLPEDPAALDTEVPEQIAEDMVAVVRESLANAARHAHASAVAVAITLFREGVDRVVQVSVSDNGRGIDPGVTRRSGLANMASRARRHQGWVDAIPLEPGTMISWRVTLPAD